MKNEDTVMDETVEVVEDVAEAADPVVETTVE